MTTAREDPPPEVSRRRRDYLASHEDQRRLVDEPGFLASVAARIAELEASGSRETMTLQQFLDRYPDRLGE